MAVNLQKQHWASLKFYWFLQENVAALDKLQDTYNIKSKRQINFGENDRINTRLDLKTSLFEQKRSIQ